MSEGIHETTLDGMHLASLVLGLWMAGDAAEVNRLGVVFPWGTYLSDSERRECSRELLETARACSATEEYLPLLACAKELFIC